MDVVDGEALAGGWTSGVVRVGDTVRRARRPKADAIHRLLEHFERLGFDGAPRFVADNGDHELLSYVDGDVPWSPSDIARLVDRDEVLAAVARLVRTFHDLTAGSAVAGAGEVVCHRDLAPCNTVFRAGAPVAFIDWDTARPGRREEDLGSMLARYLLDPPATASVVARQARAIVDGYGLDPSRRGGVWAAVIEFLEKRAGDIQAAADEGGRGAQAMVSAGIVEKILQQRDWVVAHRRELDAALERKLGAA